MSLCVRRSLQESDLNSGSTSVVFKRVPERREGQKRKDTGVNTKEPGRGTI